ncbi:MAG: hypothetical protein GX044_00385 [Firmicutes bacterium]|jgi:3D (Asp-Asp-Asp) domain-containing protein|nr:hypothetical protein [Bacillota bacterium]
MIPLRHIYIMAAVFMLFFVFTVYDLNRQLHQARQEITDAKKLELEAGEYTVREMNITMYAPLSAGAVRGQDFAGNPALTASGEKVVPGETAAAGPNIPFGTRIYVEGLGWYTVQDRGSAIGPDDIDLAVETVEEALRFGKQRRLVIFKGP